MGVLKNIYKFLLQVLVAVSVCSIVLLTAVVALQVITRQLQISLPWTEELSRFALIWLTYSGTTLALAENRHLSVQFFVDLAKNPLQKIIRAVAKIIILLFYVVITAYGLKLTQLSMITKSSTLQWPMGIIYAILPVTAVISIMVLIVSFTSKEVKHDN